MDSNDEPVDDEREGEKDRMFVTALARGLDVLRSFTQGDNMLGNQEIAKRTSLPKPTVCRMTHTLTKLGYLQFNKESEKYRGCSGGTLDFNFFVENGLAEFLKPSQWLRTTYEAPYQRYE